MRIFIILLLGGLLVYSCDNSSSSTETNSIQSVSTASTHHVKALEIIQTTSYTYLRVEENNEEFWIAVSKISAAVGDEFYFSESMEMKDFQSTELNRVFPSVFFVQDISTTPIQESDANMHKDINATVNTMDSSIVIEPIKGGITISELFRNSEKYNGKKVIVKGKVVKVNSEIMGKNWIHVQDGTSEGQNFDLTITTSEVLTLNEIVAFEGVISLNKDFGAGYKYDLIMEDATKK
jgi:hypothetical protein